MDDNIIPDRPKTCEMCFGPLALLGVLGWLAWFRCVNCGLEFSGPATAEQEATS